MSAIKKYFKDQFSWDMLTLRHSNPTDFYLSCWQKTRSCVPILIFRFLLFLLSLSVMIASIVVYIQDDYGGYWIIYLTHWGLIINVVTTALSCVVCVRCYLKGPLSQDFPIPWYVKVYWVLYNIAVPIAFLITLFYWTVLYPAQIREELNIPLDIFVHAINSVTMFLLLITSKQPMRLMHLYQPLIYGFVFMVFTIVYYSTGGVNYQGYPYIYSVLYWGDAGFAILYSFISALLIFVFYILTVLLSEGRDFLSNLLIQRTNTVERPEDVPLKKYSG